MGPCFAMNTKQQKASEYRFGEPRAPFCFSASFIAAFLTDAIRHQVNLPRFGYAVASFFGGLPMIIHPQSQVWCGFARNGRSSYRLDALEIQS